MNRYWTYKLEKDFSSIYERSISREYQQQFGNDKSAFIRSKGNVDYHAYEIGEVIVDGESGTAEVMYTYNHTLADFRDRPPQEDVVTEEWILEDGVWHREFDPLQRGKKSN